MKVIKVKGEGRGEVRKEDRNLLHLVKCMRDSEMRMDGITGWFSIILLGIVFGCGCLMSDLCWVRNLRLC